MATLTYAAREAKAVAAAADRRPSRTFVRRIAAMHVSKRSARAQGGGRGPLSAERYLTIQMALENAALALIELRDAFTIALPHEDDPPPYIEKMWADQEE